MSKAKEDYQSSGYPVFNHIVELNDMVKNKQITNRATVSHNFDFDMQRYFKELNYGA